MAGIDNDHPTERNYMPQCVKTLAKFRVITWFAQAMYRSVKDGWRLLRLQSYDKCVYVSPELYQMPAGRPSMALHTVYARKLQRPNE